ncbi:GNAT family N-acetyltransferase [Papillibacter cinnamivorans]|uniref:Ribosomal protein S18 acetylase RimI n=1 Tax=Papillibacter cinnamivorans DSM 12816 TaxID=1122930 RepID=A0A1W2BHV4_9FIRM|nr:GNAT family N-acetyltransferase [Papillibacter cinnamivorans]SMC72555.1 Ribosomal protein S18 acetylase RimI [Papillibacter cinnamivorans DSM 12816]
MEDVTEVREEALHYFVIRKEIPFKGKAYILVRRCRADVLPSLLRELTGDLLRLGAKQVFCSVTDPSLVLSEESFFAGEYLFRFDGTVDCLERGTTAEGFESPDPGFRAEPLTRENAPVFLTMYNECFFSVPNSATYGEEDIRRMLENRVFEGILFTFRGATAGLLELSYQDLVPELASVAVSERFRGRGLGRDIVLYGLEHLRQRGHFLAFLRVSSRNTAAYHLYLSLGFRQTDVASRWYVHRPEGV